MKSIKEFKNLGKFGKIGVAAVAGIVVGALILSTLSVMRTRVKVDDTFKDKVSEFKVGLDNGEFYIEPLSIKTEFGKYDAHIKLNVDKKNLVSLDNYNNFTYVTYTNKETTALTELLVSPKIPEDLNIKGIKNSWISNKSKIVKEGSSLKGMETIAGGYVYMAITAENLPENANFLGTVDQTTNDIKFSNHSETRDVVLNIDGIGTLNLSKISLLKDSPGIFYGKDKVLRMYNYKDDIAYIWMTHINNNLMMNTIGNVQRTDYNNLYIDKDYKNKEKMGYKTYSLMTKAGMYTFKFNEKAPDGIEKELFELLNIKKDDAKIELPFKLNETK